MKFYVVGMEWKLYLALDGGFMLVILEVFEAGILTSLILYWLNGHFKISETIIKNLKHRKVNSTPYYPD
ncbi:hypothetical protein FE392_14110 [Xenorhabdus sp. 12]|uniref:Uncharacterized protein n=1 Tax=Xenorhabdus santafensis TaxID=2582833 RepID=A0ABU4SCK3_9GAMM|nr:hypothetical protein [Xenorhabdus sp. 12]MDX7988451.1 hypothetical protein [Xenorhabdus sp. 12]